MWIFGKCFKPTIEYVIFDYIENASVGTNFRQKHDNTENEYIPINNSENETVNVEDIRV